MKVSTKLFLTLTGFTCFILATTLILARWSFEQGFHDFNRGIEIQRLEQRAEEILELYTEAGSDWRNVRGRSVKQLLEGRRLRRSRPPPEMRGGPPPRHLVEPAAPGEPQPFRGRMPPRFPPTALHDADGTLVVGPNIKPDKYQVVVPIFEEGELIGELRSHPTPIVSWELANAFSAHQLQNSVAIGIVGIIFSALISLFLTRHLLKPIVAIRKKVSMLTEGDYSSSFDLSRKDELGELIEDIATLSTTLDKTRKANKRWIADISHELRTPLTILTGEIETLKAGYRPLDQIALSSIEQEVARLSVIVNDLYQLSLADIGGLTYNFANQDISGQITRAIDTCRGAAHEKNIQIIYNQTEPRFAKIDESRIQQLFLNLLNNAIAYTDPPGKIFISLTESEQRLIIEFDDTAPGIDALNCEHIFEPLFREDLSRARRGSGAGLGLSICSSIVEAHKGNINAKPSPHGGLKITIELPRSGNQDDQ